MSSQKQFKRLTENVKPKNYQLQLAPDVKKLTFQGNVKIDLQIAQPTNEIVLNSLELDITSASYHLPGGESQSSKAIRIDDDKELATFVFDKPVGSGHLELEFTGILNDRMKGFYRSKYLAADGSNEVRYAAVTKFEPTHARRAFPCFDEPALKATFDVVLVVPEHLVALSNMNVIEEHNAGNNLKSVKYATSPIMSTYLVAFVVGEYDYVECMSDDVKVRIYTPVGKKNQGLFALDVAAKALPYYRNYFKLGYPLPKLDLITISEFASGAMENWGLITYREARLLVDEKNSAMFLKQQTALTICHEIGHQWFGNLCTMEWWSDLWLNEGYASFVEYLCVDHIFPSWNIWTEFVTQDLMRALELDALHNSHPIEMPVGHPSEITSIFDAISYSKGASVIRMLHRYLGDADFRVGMAHYLKKHEYANAKTADLWAALEEASKKPVRDVMSSWTKQKGFPVINVKQQILPNKKRLLELTQVKFSADGKLMSGDDQYLWMVPITVSTSKNPGKVAAEILLTERTGQLELSDVDENDWIKLNVGAVGVYRVQYDASTLQQLIPAIESKQLPALDRLSVQSDIFALVQAGRMSAVDVLKLMQAYKNEDDYTVWTSIDAALAKLSTLLSHTDFQEQFNVYGRDLLQPIYQKLGWKPLPDEPHTDGMLRSLVINRLASFGDQEVLRIAKEKLETQIAGNAQIEADLRSAVYRACARACKTEQDFDQLLSIYRSSDMQEEKDRVSRALGAVNCPLKIEKVLEFAISDEVRSQDSVFVIVSVAATKNGRDLAWKFFKKNASIFQTRYDAGHFLINGLVKYVTQNFASEDAVQEIEQFFKNNAFPGTERTVQQSIETIRLHSNWLARDGEAVKNFISNL